MPGTVPELPVTEHVYFLLDEIRDRIRIGSTYNLLDRLYDHQGPANQGLKVLGVLEGGVPREQEIHKLFAHLNLPSENRRGQPKKRATGKEWYRNAPELREWIARNTKPWDRSDTFLWHQVTPTLAMHASLEWISWVEKYARQSRDGAGTLVERALAALAEKEGYPAPPAR